MTIRIERSRFEYPYGPYVIWWRVDGNVIYEAYKSLRSAIKAKRGMLRNKSLESVNDAIKTEGNNAI